MSPSRIRVPVISARGNRAISIALIAVTAAALIANTLLTTPQNSPQPVDYGLFGPAGADILTGHWTTVFSNDIVQAGPLELVFWGVPYLLGVDGYLAWIVVGLVAGVVLSLAFAAVAIPLLRPLTAIWAIPLGLAATAVAALSGTVTRAITVGHPAEYAIPLMWVIAAVLARGGRAGAAAAIVAASTGWELWGLLGVPVLLLAPRIRLRTVWISAVAGIAVVALLFLPFALLGPFEMFRYAWDIRDGSLARLLFPHGQVFAWPLRLAQGVVAIGAGVAVALVLPRDRNAIWLVPLAVCAVRLFTDPVLAGYYTIPSLLLVLIGASFVVAQRSLALSIASLIAFNLISDFGTNLIAVGLFMLVVAGMTVLARVHPHPGVDKSFSQALISP
jgi:hypothetical protein